MKTVPKKSDLLSPFVIIIFTALTVQLIGNYFAKSYFIFGNDFYGLWVVLRIVVPVCVVLYLRIPFKALGLGLPKIDKPLQKNMLVMLIILFVVFAGIFFIRDYFSHYSGSFSGFGYTRASRFISFMIFTSSTLPGWEFIHRGFLLMGLIYVFTEHEKISGEKAMKFAICIVWIFEVVFHFIKPPVEALGLLAGSPILSYIAIRTRSIWTAFACHLLVELLFIGALLLQ